MLRGITFSLLAFTTASAAHADGFEGRISIRNGIAYVAPYENTHDLWKLEGTSEQTFAQLRALRDGDFLSATGELVQRNHSAYVEAVDFVGLKRILGRWVSRDGYTIEFKDFRSAVVEQQKPLPWNPQDERKVDLVYTILPLKETNWSLLMSNRKTVRVGTLSIQDTNKTLSIQIVDQSTGKIAQDISLSQSP